MEIKTSILLHLLIRSDPKSCSAIPLTRFALLSMRVFSQPAMPSVWQDTIPYQATPSRTPLLPMRTPLPPSYPISLAPPQFFPQPLTLPRLRRESVRNCGFQPPLSEAGSHFSQQPPSHPRMTLTCLQLHGIRGMHHDPNHPTTHLHRCPSF